ncbi:MAG: DUF1963 domain-containing protein [Sphingopyxis sp.]|uniref:DUF1963 domain-containing protein n=1 Tax=Sphingopyxis sp. TaxID=1908224 RepID=UPI003D80D236
MSDLQSAALTLAAATAGFLLILLLVWWMRRPRPEAALPKAPKAAKLAGESRFPAFQRKSREVEPEIEMAPSRLARISAKAPLESLTDLGADTLLPPPPAPVADPAAASPPDEIDTLAQRIESAVAEVEQQADRIEQAGALPVAVRLVPQIPPRTDVAATSWFGGHPRLDADAEWPRIRETPAVFLAQIGCDELPAGLWDGLGPRRGAFALFAHPHDSDVLLVPVFAPGEPMAPPRAYDDAELWFTPRDALRTGDLKPFAYPGLPQWPLDLIEVRPGDADPADSEAADEAAEPDRHGYDIAAPEWHPFDWDLMLALAEILAMRIEHFWRDVDGPSPAAVQHAHVERRLADLDAGGVDPDDRETLENMRLSLGELIEASEAAAATNRAARTRAEEIIAIVRDSARRSEFSADDAAAVMEALHAVRWTRVNRQPDPEGRPGRERIESLTLPLTEHHPRAPLWVHDYRSVWFDRARHAYAAEPDALPAAARAQLESQFTARVAADVASIGHLPTEYVHGFDEEAEATILELPSSDLVGWRFGDGHHLVVTLRKADIAAGRWDKARARIGN